MSTHGGGVSGRARAGLETFYARRLRATLRHVEAALRTRPTEMVYVYGKYGDEIARYAGTRDTIERPASEDHFFEGGTLTHNHPTDMSLSATDVLTARALRLAEIRAVSPSYRYSLRPPPRGWEHLHSEWHTSFDASVKSTFAYWRNHYRRDVADGQMTVAEANAAYSHQAMRSLAEEWGMVYRRSPWP